MEVVNFARPEIQKSFMVKRTVERTKDENVNKKKTDEALTKILLWVNNLYKGKVPNNVFTMFQNLGNKIDIEREEYDRNFRVELMKECESVVQNAMPTIQQKIKDNVLEDRDEWNNATNTITFMLGILDLYDMDPTELWEIMQHSNEWIDRVNRGEYTMVQLAEKLGEYGVHFEKKWKKTLEAYERILEKGEHEMVKVESTGDNFHFPNIMKWILENKMTVESFAEMCGLSVKTVENLLDNPKSDPKLSTVKKILDETGMGFRYAFGEV